VRSLNHRRPDEAEIQKWIADRRYQRCRQDPLAAKLDRIAKALKG